jgi:hypothetical protein
MVSIRSRFMMSVVLVALAYGVPAYPQSTEGRISGVVRDALGAAVPGATLTIVNQATGATQTVTSSADGSYAVSLAPGVYSVTATFKVSPGRPRRRSSSRPAPRPRPTSRSRPGWRKRSRSRP